MTGCGREKGSGHFSFRWALIGMNRKALKGYALLEEIPWSVQTSCLPRPTAKLHRSLGLCWVRVHFMGFFLPWLLLSSAAGRVRVALYLGSGGEMVLQGISESLAHLSAVPCDSALLVHLMNIVPSRLPRDPGAGLCANTVAVSGRARPAARCLTRATALCSC